MYAAGERDKPIGRRIKILAGDVYSEIADNPEVVTAGELQAENCRRAAETRGSA